MGFLFRVLFCAADDAPFKRRGGDATRERREVVRHGVRKPNEEENHEGYPTTYVRKRIKPTYRSIADVGNRSQAKCCV